MALTSQPPSADWLITSPTPTPPQDSFLDEGFILDKRIGVGQPKRVDDARILVANTAMDTDKVRGDPPALCGRAVVGGGWARVRTHHLPARQPRPALPSPQSLTSCEHPLASGFSLTCPPTPQPRHVAGEDLRRSRARGLNDEGERACARRLGKGVFVLLLLCACAWTR